MSQVKSHYLHLVCRIWLSVGKRTRPLSPVSVTMFLRKIIKRAKGKTVLIKTVLNRLERFKSFVLGSVYLFGQPRRQYLSKVFSRGVKNRFLGVGHRGGAEGAQCRFLSAGSREFNQTVDVHGQHGNPAGHLLKPAGTDNHQLQGLPGALGNTTVIERGG